MARATLCRFPRFSFVLSSVAATYSITQLQQRQLLLLLLWHITLINKPLKVAIKLNKMKTFFDACPDIHKGRQHVYTPCISYIYILLISWTIHVSHSLKLNAPTPRFMTTTCVLAPQCVASRLIACAAQTSVITKPARN